MERCTKVGRSFTNGLEDGDSNLTSSASDTSVVVLLSARTLCPSPRRFHRPLASIGIIALCYGERLECTLGSQSVCRNLLGHDHWFGTASPSDATAPNHPNTFGAVHSSSVVCLCCSFGYVMSAPMHSVPCQLVLPISVNHHYLFSTFLDFHSYHHSTS